MPGGWRLQGAKTWCTFAGKAGLLMVVARTDPDRSLGHKGLSVFLVEKPSFEGHEFVVLQEGGGTLSGRGLNALKAAVLSALLKDSPGASVYDVSAPNSPVTR